MDQFQGSRFRPGGTAGNCPERRAQPLTSSRCPNVSPAVRPASPRNFEEEPAPAGEGRSAWHGRSALLEKPRRCSLRERAEG